MVLKHSTEFLVDPKPLRQTHPTWIGVVDRPEFVVVHRDDRAFPGILYEWRRRRASDGHVERSARVIYLDGEKVLRQSWFLESFVEPAPFAGSESARPRQLNDPHGLRGLAVSRPRGGRLSKQPTTLTAPGRETGLRKLS